MYRILLIITMIATSGCAALHRWNAPGAATASPAVPPGQSDAVCSPQPTDSDLVKAVQARLTLLGYSPGPIDGVAGDQTHEAIRQYQRDHKLLQDGTVTPELLDHIKAVQQGLLKGGAVNI